ncbi:hypothetical protein BMS3Bbin04_00876 [bacterium BMS3Bbin04]|nr:hypothetical protein BMS3Bbin04_00876 [bacterium BMS3Bbin04]
MIDQGITNFTTAARAEGDRLGGHSSIQQQIDELCSYDRRGAGWFEHASITRDQRRGGHTGHNRQREVPRWDHNPDTQRDVIEVVLIAWIVYNFLLTIQTHHLTCVELEEINRFSGVAIGFRPVLRFLIDHGCAELMLASTQHRGSTKEDARARMTIYETPLIGEILVCGINRLLRLLFGSLSNGSDDRVRIGGVDGRDLVVAGDTFTRDQQVPVLTEITTNLRQGSLERLLVFRQ